MAFFRIWCSGGHGLDSYRGLGHFLFVPGLCHVHFSRFITALKIHYLYSLNDIVRYNEIFRKFFSGNCRSILLSSWNFRNFWLNGSLFGNLSFHIFWKLFQELFLYHWPPFRKRREFWLNGKRLRSCVLFKLFLAFTSFFFHFSSRLQN